MAKVVHIAVLVLGLLMIAYYLALGVAVRFGQSLQILWLGVGLLCVFHFVWWKWIDPAGRFAPRALIIALRCALAALLALFFFVEGAIFVAGRAAPVQGLDYVIVLGARVNGREPSGALRNRVQLAREYLEANPDARAVLSGGQGADEDISEAQCMLEMLSAAGVDPARLILEDRSTDTRENLKFSRALVPEGASVGLITNNFHILRAMALARAQGFSDARALPVATSWISWPHYMMREFVGLAHDFARGSLKF